VAGGGRRRRDAGRPWCSAGGTGPPPTSSSRSAAWGSVATIAASCGGPRQTTSQRTSPGARAAPSASDAGLRSRPRMPGTTSLSGVRGGRGGRGYSTLRRRGPDYERFRSGPAPLPRFSNPSAARDSAGAGPTAMLIHVESGTNVG
jgi:hypothetical protein